MCLSLYFFLFHLFILFSFLYMFPLFAYFLCVSVFQFSTFLSCYLLYLLLDLSSLHFRPRLGLSLGFPVFSKMFYLLLSFIHFIGFPIPIIFLSIYDHLMIPYLILFFFFIIIYIVFCIFLSLSVMSLFIYEVLDCICPNLLFVFVVLIFF